MSDAKIMRISAGNLRAFMVETLSKADVREDVSEAVTHSLILTSLRGVDSHGIALFPHYVKVVKGGRINPAPAYRFERRSTSTGLLDADHTFGHAAAMRGAKEAVHLAAEAGSGHVAVYNSSHFGAAATYALAIADQDMIGMSFTNTDALIQTHGAKDPFLGNNPICVAIPCDGEEPVCLDMATSVMTFNRVKQLYEAGEGVPPGVGADREGNETTNPAEMKSLYPVGGYKGFGLSLVVEVLCSLLTGMPYGPRIPRMFDAPLSQKRRLGHFIMALRIDAFQSKKVFKQRMAEMICEIRSQSPKDKRMPVMVAGDPEKAALKERRKMGIPISKTLFQSLTMAGRDVGVDLERMLSG